MLRGGILKKTIAVLTILAVVVAYLPLFSFAAETADEEMEKGTVVYRENFENGKGIAVQSGGANLTPVTGVYFDGNDDGAALYISNRQNNWDGADFLFDDMGLKKGITYTVTVIGYVDGNVEVPQGAQVYLQTATKDYGWLAGADFAAGKEFVLTGKLTVGSNNDDRIRIQSNDDGASVPFYVGEIVVTFEEDTSGNKEKVVYHETFENGKGAAVQSGSASLTPVTGVYFDGNDDGAALYISNRQNNWDGADFHFTDLKLEDGKEYSVTVTGYVYGNKEIQDGAQVYLQTVDSYGWLAGANMEEGKAFKLTASFTPDSSKDRAIRVQSNDKGANVSFYIGDILITTMAESDDEEPLPPAEQFTPITFEDGTENGFSGRAGTEKLTVTDEANHTEGGKYALKVEGRTATWHGPALRVEKYIDQGSEYKVSVWVKLIEPASARLVLSTQIGDGSSANYVNLEGKAISTNDDWVLLEGTYRYSNIRSGFVTIYVESSDDTNASFYIDDVNFEKTGSGPVEIEKDLLPIKDVYKDCFLIGTAISAEDLEGVRFELLKMHFNIATAGNAMKPDALQRLKGTFTFDAADDMVNTILENGMKMHGHTLVWHQQTPSWMYSNDDGTPLSREEALENMRNHIRTVMEHFGNRVISWDVVNEAMSDNPSNPSDWKASLRQSEWYQAIGDDYVEQAFLAAREVLDEHPEWDIKLYYNDYNLDNQNKSKAVYNMVKELNEKYQKEHPGKLLIDGIGMQGHYNVNTNPTNVELSLERFIELGVEVSITELDIMAGSNYQLPENLAKAQGYLYAQLFKIFREHADNIARVTLWGMDDGTSWRASSNPLLFDKNLKAKPAYYGVIDPDKFIEENKPDTTDANRSTAYYGTPVIDGKADGIWSKAPVIPINRYQTAWQGATGTARALWDDNNLYVLIQVNDTELDKASPNPWEQDSIEVFVDENNAKTSYYQDDDGQYRVNYENETSFNPESIKEGFESAVAVSGTNYTVEVKIPFRTITPKNNTEIGFDVQINDGKNGSRQSIATWNDVTGNAYQDTSVFGILTLSGKGSQSEDTEEPSDESDSSSSSSQQPVDASGRITVAVKLDARTGLVSADVDSKAFTLAYNRVKADENGRKTIEVTVPAIQSAKMYELNMPMEAVSAHADVSIRIKTGLAEIILPGNMLNGTDASDGQQVSLTVSTADLSAINEETRALIGNRPVISLEIKADGRTVQWNNPDTRVTISIPYTPAEDELNNTEYITVWYIDGEGNIIPVPSGRYNPETGMVTFTTTHFSSFAVVYVIKTFSDLESVQWAKEAIEVLASKGIMKGVSEDKFAPNENITRAEFLYSLIKALSVDAKTDGNFDDISADAYYNKEIAVAKALGITLGCGNNLFKPDEPVTRQDMLVLTDRALSLLGKLENRGTAEELDRFADKSLVADYAIESIATLIKEGIIEDEGDSINPRGITTRAEAAVLLYRIYNR